MGIIVVDTSVLVDHLRGVSGASSALTTALSDNATLACSVLTKVELLAGMRSRERRAIRELINALTWVEVSAAVAENAGVLARRYRHSHPGVDIVDFVIAATVEQIAGVLWTRNTHHFPMFPTLEPPY